MTDPNAPIYKEWGKNEVIRPAFAGCYLIILTVIALFLVMSILVNPVLAQTETITAPDGQAIKYLTIASNEGTEGTITFLFNDGSTLDGSWSYEPGTLSRTGSITLNGETAGTTYITLGKFYTRFLQVNAMLNASDMTIRGAYGQIDGAWYNYVETSSPQSPIISVTFSSTSDVTYKVEYWDIGNASANANGGDFVSYILSLVWMFIGFITELASWLKFFFIDNLLLIVALYIALTGAMAFGTTKNIFQALKKFFNYQKKLIEFILSLWQYLISLAGWIRGLFKIV
jgi:hypothetical protein